MTKRFLRGQVRLIGDVSKGRDWQEDPAGNERKHPRADLGARPEMTKMEAMRKLADLIEKSGLNKSDDVERLRVPAGTFTQVCDASKKKKLPALALSSRTELPGQLAMHFFYGERTSGRLFNSRLGTALCDKQLKTVLRSATEKVGLKVATMHAFRHGGTSLLGSRGFPTQFLRDHVGHQNKRTT